MIVGKPDTNIKKVGSCKFLKIKVSDVDDFFVFEEGKTRVTPTSTKPSEETHIVYFDFKKHEIRSDAQSKLKLLISLLMANSHGKIIIDAHADERGADNFNMKLSQDRAESVMNFLKNNGLGKSKFEPHGHGENQLIFKGKTLNEEQHQKNRRATIRFNYYDTTLAPIVYETIVPTAKKPRNITVSAITRETKGCRYPKGEHKTIMIKGDGKETKKQGDSLVQPGHSIIGDDFVKNYLIYFGKYINYLSTIHINYYAYINSCIYYPQKENPTLHIKAYPDIVWLAHGKYDYDEDYFFHNHSLSLQKGFAPEFSAVLDEIYNLGQYIGISNYLTKDILLAYIKKEAEKLEIGLHATHDRTLEKKRRCT
ncbi:MAG: OmpA family protein [Flavobacterium sp.]|nr:MAG: OmpA family protein [Flavobacterium sp.]